MGRDPLNKQTHGLLENLETKRVDSIKKIPFGNSCHPVTLVYFTPLMTQRSSREYIGLQPIDYYIRRIIVPGSHKDNSVTP